MTRSTMFGTHRRKHLATLVLVTAVGASALGACGGQSSPSATEPAPTRAVPANVVLESVRTTTAAKTARMSVSVSVGDSGSSGEKVALSGITDFATGDSEFTLHIAGGSGPLGGDIVERTVDGVVYMKLPDSVQSRLGLPAGAQWISLALPQAGSLGGAMPGADQSDPGQFLAYLETVSGDVKTVGTEQVRGVDTTHYSATLDLEKAADQAKVPPELREKLKHVLATSGLGSSKMAADVWIDADGHLRRLTLGMSIGSVTLELYDFGAPVAIAAPPADQVASLPGLGGLFGGGGSAPSGQSGKTSAA